jgi:chromosome segregation protein
MQFTKIKLSGFKSFVDPTLIHFKNKLVAIVGPNGCGKSNIIDGVRWVMGESSAKQLRGEAMADVIFNGSVDRQPVGQASIELFFDNTDTMLTGEYAKYNEIAIQREVNRDGISNYYLNGTHCRRKDIVDIFLGTGLGPNSYAIIRQGVISQLIEAKPDELRIYFEEAAGISKYKERRRETENRITHTRDNLSRLNDIREELQQQLRHLKRQANAANRYNKFKSDQRLLKAQLQALHWRTINDQVVEQEAGLKQQEIGLEKKMAAVSKITSEIEKLRVQQVEASEVFHEVQARYYKQGADVGRLEQQIQHNKERYAQLGKDLLHVDETYSQAEQNINDDKCNIDKLNIELKNLHSQVVVKETEDSVSSKLVTAEQNMQKWQAEWDRFNEKAAQTIKQMEVENTKITHLMREVDNETECLEKLYKEQAESPSVENLAKEISVSEIDDKKIKAHSESLKNSLIEKREHIVNYQKQINRLLEELNAASHELQELHGQRVSLEILQQVALGNDDKQINSWLTKHKLIDKPRLAQDLQVEAGWEKAVETVLSNYLNAVCVDNIAELSAALQDVTHGNITLFDAGYKRSFTANKDVLANKVQSTLSIAELLSHIYVATTLSEALELRSSLKPYESVVTSDGIWAGSNWLCINFDKDKKQGGVLQRKRELQELNKHIQNAQKVISDKKKLLQKAKANLADLEKQREQLQQEFDEITSKYSDNYSKLNVERTHLEHLQQCAITRQQGITECQRKLASAQEQLQIARTILREAEQNKSSDDNKRGILLAQSDKYKKDLQAACDLVKEAKQNADKLTMRIQFARDQSQYLQQGLQRIENQLINLKERKITITELQKDIQSLLDSLNKQLELALENRLVVENELTTAKRNLDNTEYVVRETETNLTTLQNEAQQVRDHLEQLRVDWKALQVRCVTYEEQITELGFELETLLQEIPEEAELTEWKEKLEHITKRIERLGPINLAAINEFEQKQKRKEYLDAQNDDLTEALTTLESAIQKIDRESRNRFKQTFDIVNSKFSELFPIIFGGGRACLQMNCDDLLSTGIEIIAQPPGKRNATIHLLSGGEKALVAIALVFAIFQLNPAPFCMLDEVDAPLDDNNIIRFCNLVKDMSNKIQFIIVTHNKTTMEIVEQLTGVTMQEAGVSRIVSVNIEDAIKMAEK